MTGGGQARQNGGRGRAAQGRHKPRPGNNTAAANKDPTHSQHAAHSAAETPLPVLSLAGRAAASALLRPLQQPAHLPSSAGPLPSVDTGGKKHLEGRRVHVTHVAVDLRVDAEVGSRLGLRQGSHLLEHLQARPMQSGSYSCRRSSARRMPAPHCETGHPARLAHTIPMALPAPPPQLFSLRPSQCATNRVPRFADPATLGFRTRSASTGCQHGIVGAGNTRPPKLSRPA